MIICSEVVKIAVFLSKNREPIPHPIFILFVIFAFGKCSWYTDMINMVISEKNKGKIMTSLVLLIAFISLLRHTIKEFNVPISYFTTSICIEKMTEHLGINLCDFQDEIPMWMFPIKVNLAIMVNAVVKGVKPMGQNLLFSETIKSQQLKAINWVFNCWEVWSKEQCRFHVITTKGLTAVVQNKTMITVGFFLPLNNRLPPWQGNRGMDGKVYAG